MAEIRDLTKGSIPAHMVLLAVPLIAGNILQQLYIHDFLLHNIL